MSNAPFYKRILESDATKICVVAGPGSGKTTQVLIPKARQLIEKESIGADEVLLLSFSRMSALDLKEKVRSLEKTPKASTVHSYALSFLLSEDDHDIRDRIHSILLDFEKDVLLADLKLTFPQIYKRDLRVMLTKFSAGWATQPHEVYTVSAYGTELVLV